MSTRRSVKGWTMIALWWFLCTSALICFPPSHSSVTTSLYLCVSSSSLRPLDVEFMRRLSKVVNIVPVIAKADTLTLEERDDFKQTVRGVCVWMCVGRKYFLCELVNICLLMFSLLPSHLHKPVRGL